MAPEVICR